MKVNWSKLSEAELSAMPFMRAQLIRLMAKLNISGAELARLCGRSSVYISSVKDELQCSTIRKLKENVPNLNLDWLVMGEGEIMLNEGETLELYSSEHLLGRLFERYECLVQENVRLKIENEKLRERAKEI